MPTDDDVIRCGWGAGHVDYLAYHDDEWGRPTTDPHRLFEKICLEGFQSGLSWLTILRKRDAFRAAFAAFDFGVVSIAKLNPGHVKTSLERVRFSVLG